MLFNEYSLLPYGQPGNDRICGGGDLLDVYVHQIHFSNNEHLYPYDQRFVSSTGNDIYINFISDDNTETGKGFEIEWQVFPSQIYLKDDITNVTLEGVENDFGIFIHFWDYFESESGHIEFVGFTSIENNTIINEHDLTDYPTNYDSLNTTDDNWILYFDDGIEFSSIPRDFQAKLWVKNEVGFYANVELYFKAYSIDTPDDTSEFICYKECYPEEFAYTCNEPIDDFVSGGIAEIEPNSHIFCIVYAKKENVEILTYASEFNMVVSNDTSYGSMVSRELVSDHSDIGLGTQFVCEIFIGPFGGTVGIVETKVTNQQYSFDYYAKFDGSSQFSCNVEEVASNNNFICSFYTKICICSNSNRSIRRNAN